MNQSNREERLSISGAGTVEDIGELWDSHSLADYAEETAEVSFDLRARAQRRCRITRDPEVDPGSKQRL